MAVSATQKDFFKDAFTPAMLDDDQCGGGIIVSFLPMLYRGLNFDCTMVAALLLRPHFFM